MTTEKAVVRSAPLTSLDPETLYRILALRVNVFVVEQQCPYPELDGLDLDPATRLVWAAEGEEVVATARVLVTADGTVRIGRVATAASARGGGLAGQLMEHCLQLAGGAEVVLHAQSYLLAWYERFGFVRDGADYLEDGIPHTPMRRASSPG